MEDQNKEPISKNPSNIYNNNRKVKNITIVGGKSHRPELLHGQITRCTAGRQKEHNNVD
jgi:hypothetical protein